MIQVRHQDPIDLVEDAWLVERTVVDGQDQLRCGAREVSALYTDITIRSSISDRSDDGMERDAWFYR